VLQCVAVCCSALQCIAAVAVTCSVSQCVALSCSVLLTFPDDILHDAVKNSLCVCCSVLQHVEERCSVLQCVAVRCNVSQWVERSLLQCVVQIL